MDQHKKGLALLFMLIFAFSFCSAHPLNAFAVNSSSSELGNRASSQGVGTDSSEIDSPSDVPAQGGIPGDGSGELSSLPPSSQPPASSRAVSSKPPKKKASSSVSSAVSSEVSSELFSSEESSGIVLPSVESIAENNPLSSVAGNDEDLNKTKLIGVLSWACIALGILVVVIVVLSNRRPPRGPGRKRYRRPKRTGKKRLLNDRYYRGLNRY